MKITSGKLAIESRHEEDKTVVIGKATTRASLLQNSGS